jgi:hypothetical protein
MVRQANPVDFWRGVALVFIFVNHIPGIFYSRFTHFHYSISDSADLFVFLAGWALRLLVGTPDRRQSTWYLVLRVGGRAITIYVAQIFITMIALAMLAACAIYLNNPLLLEWHNAAAVFHDPVPTQVGLALIMHQLGYFDILPLYVVLMLIAAPIIVIIDRFAPWAVLPLSLLVYALTLAFQISVPTWPVEGHWFFNPLAWQLVFVLGFVLARDDGFGGFVHRHIVAIRWVALPIVVILLICTLTGWWWDPTRVPQPRLFFLIDKAFETPVRLIQFLALIAVMSVTYPYILKGSRSLVNFLSMLGRNSLYVFCVASILSLAGQIIRFVTQGNIFIDTAVVACGIAIMALTAWLPEWREDWRGRRGAAAAQPS